MRYQSFLIDSGRWEGFRFRPGDIIISTPAKCGTTWTQMICALLVFQTPELPRSLDQLSPWMEMRLRRRRDVFELFDADLAAHYETQVRKLAAADLVAWLHPRGTGGDPPTEAA